MPRPLIFLENHSDLATSQFLIKHAKKLHELGYNKLFFELDSSLDIKQFFKLNKIIAKYSTGFEKEQAKLLTMLYETYINLGFVCEFIDPEPLKNAHDRNNRAKEIGSQYGTISPEFKQVMDEFESATANRDIIMTQKIVQASQLPGGLISVTGFAHQRLVQLLEKNEAIIDPCRFVIMSNGIVPSIEYNMVDIEIWQQLAQKTLRRDYYNTNAVYHMKWDRHSFEMFCSIIQLNPITPCVEHITSIQERLNQKTGLDFTTNMDLNCVVTASHVVYNSADEEKIVKILSKHFKGLNFFSRYDEKTHQAVSIDIPGVNLEDNKEFRSKLL